MTKTEQKIVNAVFKFVVYAFITMLIIDLSIIILN
jgi:hypothetical protein